MQQRDAGVVQELAPGLRGIIAPNPGPMTHWGTNTFLLGERELAVIDPGPEDAAHLDALLRAIGGATVSHILVTHAHRDHSPLARRLGACVNAPVLGFGPAVAGRKPAMEALVTAGLAGGGEGVDTGFAPDATLADGDCVTGSEWQIDVLHTPGHFAGHLAFRWEDSVFSGDHVMDWSSSLVSPPDGDLADFMATSRRLQQLDTPLFYPAHGGPLRDPGARLSWLIAHRKTREASILNALTLTPQDIAALTRAVYVDLAPAMLPAAERNVFAHLIDLVERGHARATPELALTAKYQRA